MGAGDSSHHSSSWGNGSEVGAGRRRQRKNVMMEKRDVGVVGWTRRRPTNLMKGRAQLDPYGRRLGRKVKALQKIVPNGQSAGVDGLFKETADYILGLEMRVKIMQVVLEVLNEGST